MVQSKAATVKAYLAELPPDRRKDIETIRRVILDNLDSDYEEGMQYGMIGYYIPHRIFPAGYHCDPKQPLPFAALASQKNNLAVYLMGLYCGCFEEGKKETTDATWFRAAWLKTGKKLDMGKACIRFKTAADVPLEVLGEAIRRVPAQAYIAHYEQSRAHAAAAKTTRTAESRNKPAKKPKK